MVFVDLFVIFKKLRYVDLVYEFINFFLNFDNVYENVSVVGYFILFVNVYDCIVNYIGDDVWLINWFRVYSDYYLNIENFKGIFYVSFN